MTRNVCCSHSYQNLLRDFNFVKASDTKKRMKRGICDFNLFRACSEYSKNLLNFYKYTATSIVKAIYTYKYRFIYKYMYVYIHIPKRVKIMFIYSKIIIWKLVGFNDRTWQTGNIRIFSTIFAYWKINDATTDLPIINSRKDNGCHWEMDFYWCAVKR